MPKDTREPQSYGSDKDWVSGKTGGKVHDPKATPPPEHREFYDDSRESEQTTAVQGGLVRDVQVAEASTTETRTEQLDPGFNVTTREGGAKRGSYFRSRDYE